MYLSQKHLANSARKRTEKKFCQNITLDKNRHRVPVNLLGQ